MNAEQIRRYALRFFFFLLVQVLVLKQIDLGTGIWRYIHLFFYPMFIFLLPIRWQTAIVVVLGFVMGTCIDIFYDSLGLHASALVLTAFVRQFVLGILEPHRGYGTDDNPTVRYQSYNWFFSYVSIMLFIHLFCYFSVEWFSFVYIFDIFLHTIFSFLFSLVLIFIYQILFNPE